MNQRELFLKHVAQTSDIPFSGIDLDIERAEGIFLYAKNGRQYYDMISGISVSNIGHCHPKVVNAITEQSKKYMHLMVFGEYNQSPQVKYAETLCNILPKELESVYFTTGGSEAVEGALKLAKRFTGRREIISFKNAYHGSTHGSLSVMGDDYFKNGYGPLLPDVKHLVYNDQSQLAGITTATACVIVELVQGEAGVRTGDPDFIKALLNKCNETKTLLIADEIQTGFGRSGKLFAFQDYDIVPDILTIAKGMGGGLPIGAFISSQKIMRSFTNNPVLGHINTFGGNAVCVAAAQACLEVIVEQNLSSRANEIESLIKNELKHPLIKEVRIKGALAAIDFGNEELNMRVIKKCIESGFITDWFLFCPTAMRFAPPLIISDQQLRDALKILKKVLDSES